MLIYQGSISNYLQIDLTTLQISDDKDYREIEKSLLKMHFHCIGDLMCTTYSQVLMRGYAQPNGVTYASLGALYQSETLHVLGIDFVTCFENGASLATTTVPVSNNLEKRNIFVRSYSLLHPEELFLKHSKHVIDLKKAHGATIRVTNNLQAYAKSLDDYFIRRFEC